MDDINWHHLSEPLNISDANHLPEYINVQYHTSGAMADASMHSRKKRGREMSDQVDVVEHDVPL